MSDGAFISPRTAAERQRSLFRAGLQQNNGAGPSNAKKQPNMVPGTSAGVGNKMMLKEQIGGSSSSTATRINHNFSNHKDPNYNSSSATRRNYLLGDSERNQPHYVGYNKNFKHYDHLMELERTKPSPNWHELSSYKKRFFVGQKLHESPPDEWKRLDPRVTKRVPEMSEKWRLVGSFLEARGLISCQLESFNSFVNQGIKDIVMSRSNVEIRCDVDPNWYVRFTDIQIGRPQMMDERSLQDLDVYPQQCRLRDLTYSAPIYVSYYYYAGKTATNPTVSPQPLLLGYLPIMLRSDRCHLSKKTEHDLMKMGECPLDPGGYFIIDGTEKVLMMQENMSNNRIIVEKADKKTHRLQAAVTSSTNDNKSRVIVCYNARNCLHMKHSKFQSSVNIVCLIKAMGVTDEQEIVQMIGSGGMSRFGSSGGAASCASSGGSGGGGGNSGKRSNADQNNSGGKDHGRTESQARSRILGALLPTFQEAKDLGVFTKREALEYLGRHMKDRFVSSRSAQNQQQNSGNPNTPHPSNKALQAFQALEIVLSHVAMEPRSEHTPFLAKVRYLCVMIRRIFDAEDNPMLVDDKDYYGNKRIEQASSMMSMLFEDVFKTLNSEVRKRADGEIGKLVQKQNYTDCDVLKRTVLESGKVTQTFKYALKSGNWKIQRFRVDRSGVSQVLSRFSYMIALGSMTKVKSNVEKSHKIAGPRALQPSQWGMLCPADTPEGEQCGLIKNLSLMATVTTGLGDTALAEMKALIESKGVTMPDESSASDQLSPDSPDTLLVFFNGLLLGSCRDPNTLMTHIKELRRRGVIFQFTSIYHHENTKTINIACDEGRLCRPLLIVENGKCLFDPKKHVPLLTGRHPDGTRAKRWTFTDFLNNGVVEFVDVNEENNLLIAMKHEELTKDHTHLEIEPLTLLGVISGLVAYPNHNQSPRNTYTCAMGKQAMGCIGYNQFQRSDNVLYLLHYPQKPLCKSKTLDFAQYDRFGAGINASVAVISYSGYDIEDAIVMNKASIDRGFGRCIVMKRHVGVCDQVGSHSEVVAPLPKALLQDKRKKREKHRVRNLDPDDGVVWPGSVVGDGDIILNKQTPDMKATTPFNASSITNPEQAVMRDNPVCHKMPVDSKDIIDRVLITHNDQHLRIFKMMYRDTRRPELGDKFASRHGQKGVIGLIVPQQDMPFSETGWCPDLIMNPHGFPSRMTVGKMLECVGSKAAALEGTFCDGSAFGGTPPQKIYSTLIQHGFAPNGKEFLTSGITGEPMECYVFVGPIFYQKLKHMVADKVQARARGKLNVLTRQPTEGRAKQGGLRMGEMERDCLIAYGASNLLLERLNFSSDVTDVKICRDCGLFADANFCRYCDESGDSKGRLLDCRVPYACKLLFQEMQCMNVVARIGFEEV
ncbi:unnamed protein product [Amoebophrya sp. A120]|nr:unnamed protein product [Amoebophrya sp. A120]|eukprot:GSA120T00012134001.1